MLIHKENTELSNISRCSNKDLFAIGGKNVLKILSLTSENTFITLQKLKETKSKSRTGTTDLTWNPIFTDYLASCSLFSPQIFLWNLEKLNIQVLPSKIGSHEQLINRINWNLNKPNILASCSYDKFIKIWDKNNKVNKDSNEPIPIINIETKERLRDCQFSPKNEYYLLSSFVDGQIKLWDIREYSNPIKTFFQHLNDVLSIDWHPNLENIFCSGGMDKNLYIWNIEKDVPLLTYKTSVGISRVKWFNPNPQYIISSYQINNFWTSIWNINIPNIPEYKYDGYKNVVTGFCWDLSNKKLITCDKNGDVNIKNFEDGNRTLDNICTSLVKFSPDNDLFYYYEKKPDKKDFFECNLDKLKGIKEEEKKNVVKIMNFNQKYFTMANIPNLKGYKIKLNSEVTLDFTTDLQQYYSYNREQIQHILNEYAFILDYRNNIIKYNNLKLNNDASFTEKVKSAIIYNLNYAKNEIKNYNHIKIWEFLNFHTSLECFKVIDNIINNIKEEQSSQLFFSLTKTKILTIIDFLIDTHCDIYLATIISLLFHPIFEKDEINRNRLIRMEYDCMTSLFELKLYKEANIIRKFSYKEINRGQVDSIMFVSCNKCNTYYDATKVGECTCCKRKIICGVCKKLVLGLYFWCSDCGHGGHNKCMDEWFSKEKNCSFGCKHKCIE